MRITTIERYGEHGWTWTEAHSADGMELTVRCRTNSGGEGIWRWSEADACWQQQLGTLQYRIDARDETAARAQIQHRWLHTHADVASPADYADAHTENIENRSG